MPDNDEFTLSLLSNDEALAVNQKATSSKQLFARGNQIAWIAGMKGSPARYLAVFNTGGTSVTVMFSAAEPTSRGRSTRSTWSTIRVNSECL